MDCTINREDCSNNSFKIIRNSMLLDFLLEPWKDLLGKDFTSFKNHSLRMINFCNYILEPDEIQLQHIIIASAYHQIGLWKGKKKSYTLLSAETLLFDAGRIGLDPIPEHIIEAIIKHTNIKNDFEFDECFQEAFWRSFRIEFSMGYSEQGLPSDFIKQVRECIPTLQYNKINAEKLFFSFASLINKQ